MELKILPAKLYVSDHENLRGLKPTSRVEELEITVNDLIDYIDHLRVQNITLEDNLRELYQQVY
jgi:hypothetical protein